MRVHPNELLPIHLFFFSRSLGSTLELRIQPCRWKCLCYNSFDPEIVEFVVPGALRARLLELCKITMVAGHPGQNLVNLAFRREYYSAYLAADFAATVR